MDTMLKGKQHLNFAISGYLRKIGDKTHMIDEILKIINSYSSYILLSSVKEYAEICISDTENNKSLKSGYSYFNKFTESSFDKESIFYLNRDICIKCMKLETNVLTLVNNYSDTSIDTRYADINKYYYDCNEYKCKYCGYYISYLIKTKYINCRYYQGRKRNTESFTRKSPLRTSKSSTTRTIEKDDGQCNECGHKLKKIFSESYSSGYYTKYQTEHYCTNCEIYTYYRCSDG